MEAVWCLKLGSMCIVHVLRAVWTYMYMELLNVQLPVSMVEGACAAAAVAVNYEYVPHSIVVVAHKLIATATISYSGKTK